MARLFCGPTGTGTQDGSDLNNRMQLPSSTGFVRGNTYVIIKGNYGNRVLSTATSGTTTIQIEFLTSADSGVAGYSASLHDEPAIFAGINPRTQYWIMDGKHRTEAHGWIAPLGYGIKAHDVSASSLDGDNCSNSTFRYMDIGSAYEVNPSAATINGYANCISVVYDQTDVVFERCAIHNGKNTLLQGAGADNITLRHCNIGPGWGKEALRGGNQNLSTGWTVEYCKFWNSTQFDPNDPTSGITAEIAIWASNTGSFDNHKIHGNWFHNEHISGRNAVIVIGGDGTNWVGVGGQNNQVHNNTFEGIADDSAFADVLLNGSNNSARNNLFYNCASSDVSASTTSNNVVALTDPFVDVVSHDLRLTAHTENGFTLGAPFDVDPLGNTRGTGGVWDLGTYQLASSMADNLLLNQTPNSGAVTELWRRAAAPSGAPADMIIQHSGSYPSQPVNDFVYTNHGPHDELVYVFEGTLTLAEAQAARNAL